MIGIYILIERILITYYYNVENIWLLDKSNTTSKWRYKVRLESIKGLGVWKYGRNG